MGSAVPVQALHHGGLGGCPFVAESRSSDAYLALYTGSVCCCPGGRRP